VLFNPEAKIKHENTSKHAFRKKSAKYIFILNGSLVSTAWHILKLWLEKTASMYGGQMQI
jgi:hypothetical protein